MSNPFDQFDMETPEPQEGYKYGQLGERVSQSAEEVAQTSAIESRDRVANLERVTAELGRPGLSEKQKAPLLAEQARLKAGEPPASPPGGNPFDQFDQASPEADKGFLETLKNPWELWTSESLPAHLASAYKKGVFDKPVGELVHDAGEAVKSFSVKGLVEAAKANPGKFAGEFVNTVVADPYLLLPVFWEALGGRLAVAGGSLGAKLGGTAAKVGTAAGRATEVALTGAGVSGAVSAGEQLDRAGFIDPAKLSQDMEIGAGMAAGLSGMLTLGGMMVKARPSGLAEEVAAAAAKGDDPVNAARDALKKAGMEKSKAQDLADSIAPYRDEAAAERLAAQERISRGEAAGYGEEPSALAARADFLEAKKSLSPSEAKELVDIQTYREVLPELGVGPKAADVLTPSQAKAWIERKLPEAPLDTFVKAKTPEILEQGPVSIPANKQVPRVLETPEPTIADLVPHAQKVSTKPLITSTEQLGHLWRQIAAGKTAGDKAEIRAAAQRLKSDLDAGLVTPEETLRRMNESVKAQEFYEAVDVLHGDASTVKEARQSVEQMLSNARAAQKIWYAHTDVPAFKMPVEMRGELVKASPAKQREMVLAASETIKQGAQSRLGPGFKERGIMDPEMAKWMALTIGGGALGGYLSDDKGKGAVLGAALTLGGGIALRAGRHIVTGGLEAFDKGMQKFKALQRDPHIAKQIDEIVSAHESTVAGMGLASDRLAYALKELVPDKVRREAITMAIDSGDFAGLSPKERTAARLFQEEDLAIGHEAQKRGVMGDLIDNHISHMWEDEGKARAAFSGMSGESRFAQARTIPSFKVGMKLGLKPKTLDVAEIAQMYGRSVGKSMANKEILDTLKTVKVAGMDKQPVMPRAEAPADYAPLPHPQLQGMLVHPDMAPSLSFLFHANNIPAYLQAATAVSAAAKQGLLNFSLFHVKSLFEVGLGIGLGLGSPKTLTKIPAMVEMLRKGKAGDFVDQAIRAGLKVDAHGFDMDTGAWAKLSNAIVTNLEKVPVAGKVAALPVKGIERLSEALNHFLWEYLHPAIKLATANVAYTKALEREAGKLAKDATYKAPSPNQIMREVAGATNDLFGGLNWRQVSGEIESRFLHGLSASMTNPEGLRLLRVGLLAPDWLVSTVRAGYKGIKATAKSAIPGTKISVAEDLYRRYFLGGALMTGAVMEGLQQHFTGTHFWDNEDPTKVYLPDGRTIQVAKHFTEIFHWLKDPAGTAVDKLGYVPKEVGAQLLSKEYISTKGMPTMQDQSIPGRIGHAAKGMLPIGVQEVAQGRGAEAVSGALGVPIHGRSLQEREEAKRKRRMEISRRRQRQSKRTYR